MNKINSIIDSLNISLENSILIEAAAGTGKTYNIIILYLRLLLCLGNKSIFHRPLEIKEILLVTFTESATKELRNRIYHNIHELRLSCLNQEIENPMLNYLLNEIKNKKQAAKLLLRAEQQIDEASIFTIHSFCQRMLNIYAFEFNILIKQKVIEDESNLIYQACTDFWRRYCYPLPYTIAKIIFSIWKGPETLFNDLNTYIRNKSNSKEFSSNIKENLVFCHKKIIANIIQFKNKWHNFSPKINDIIDSIDINRRKFNRVNQAKYIEEINTWAQTKTCNYNIPKVLIKFSQKFLLKCINKSNTNLNCPLFISVETFLSKHLVLKKHLVNKALMEIIKIVNKEKYQTGILGFDDMLNYFNKALNDKNGNSIAIAIRNKLPIAIIDEFQDTDDKQYRIFRRIWFNQSKSVLLLIGDPKQAIYSFRGANISTYIKARKEIKKHYTLDTNWRSSHEMVTSINKLFQSIDNPFIYKNIKFQSVNSAKRNKNFYFKLYKKQQPAISIWLMKEHYYRSRDRLFYMAQNCAIQICNLLNVGLSNDAILHYNNNIKSLKASDITILVRNKNEAGHMKNALDKLNIPSVYLSDRKSVFETIEAREILWLLQAVIMPKRNEFLRRALASSILCLNAKDIDNFNKNELFFFKKIEEFNSYHYFWDKYGIMFMLRKIIFNYKITENILLAPNGKSIITNIFHIIELLQEVSQQIKSKHALVNWLSERIDTPNDKIINQQIRVEHDNNSIKIVTIFKSKGLEYPIVWLPFISNLYVRNQLLNNNISFLKQKKYSIEYDNYTNLAKKEKLAEDMRLLYVALTRSILHCSLGINPIFNKSGNNNLHKNSLGRLIQLGESKDSTDLLKCLKNISDENISVQFFETSNKKVKYLKEDKSSKLNFRNFNRIIKNDDPITSYSKLKNQNSNISLNLDYEKKLINIKKLIDFKFKTEFNQYNFPRGKLSGIFIHKIFEKIDFTKSINEEWLLKMLQKNGFDARWQHTLTNWINNVLQVKLLEDGFALNKLTEKDKIVEMEFYLPIIKLINIKKFNLIINNYDSISKKCQPLDFDQISGMLSGFIDLIFCYKNKYYLVDYKNNWLGENNKSYSHNMIINSMKYNRYDLQYQLYSLALHRYLKYRFNNYDYDTHFGGVIYLFLRGINIAYPNSGIFKTRPVKPLINEIDNIFMAKK